MGEKIIAGLCEIGTIQGNQIDQTLLFSPDIPLCPQSIVSFFMPVYNFNII